jgi:Lon protease-like protein
MSDPTNHAGESATILPAVPLFPLPNVVLLPRAVLPLHIFEERYKTMTADALAGDKQIAMALLKPGWEKNYYNAPAIEPVVCVGTIVSHEQLPDGTYNFLLQGHTRAKIAREVRPVGTPPYRRADLQPLAQPPVLEIDLSDQRRRLESLLTDSAFAAVPLVEQFLQMLSGPLTTSDIADLIAFNLLDDVNLKQRLLEEPNPRQRIDRVIGALDELRPPLQTAAGHSMFDPSVN